MRSNLAVFLLLAVALLVPSLAMATPPPAHAAIVTAIAAAATPIGAIGAAVLLVLVGIKVLKWVRRAF